MFWWGLALGYCVGMIVTLLTFLLITHARERRQRQQQQNYVSK
jgi:hypothetical protein